MNYERSFSGSFIGTTLWVLPLLLLFGVGGYIFARFVLAPRLLEPNKVSVARPQPIRVLSPEEAASIARDEPSPVWTQGVRDADIPRMDNGRNSQWRRHNSEHALHKDNDSTAPEGKSAPDTNTPVDAPAIDNGDHTTQSTERPTMSTPPDTPATDNGGNGAFGKTTP